MKSLMRGQIGGVVLLLGLAVAGCAGPISNTQISPGSTAEPTLRTGAADQSPGMRIHLDRQSGEITIPAPATAAVEAQKQSVTIKPQPMYEQLSPTPGGGVMIELNEQFQKPVTATLDAGGKVSVQH